MAEAVAAAVTEGRHLVVRAGTGTGKTLGYLVPAILSGRRVVVATATRALQDQLAAKDLPFLDEHLDHPFDWAVLKGRSNYVCVQRLAELASRPRRRRRRCRRRRASSWGSTRSTGSPSGPTPTSWRACPPGPAPRSPATGPTSTSEPSEAAWAAVSTTSRDCPGAAPLPPRRRCFAEAARARAAEADVVVVNLHLYGLDLATDGAILPDHDVAIIDEAHQVDDIISATAGVELGGRAVHPPRPHCCAASSPRPATPSPGSATRAPS